MNAEVEAARNALWTETAHALAVALTMAEKGGEPAHARALLESVAYCLRNAGLWEAGMDPLFEVAIDKIAGPPVTEPPFPISLETFRAVATAAAAYASALGGEEQGTAAWHAFIPERRSVSSG
ncbi:hypothetical protein [Siccirubricoccus phaeus]|uniref:hypothetical protein n=1 Tax=Siccirubricoccus phaeus TaxID=2595053 RepID=UPI0011F3E861|nr:hypothetical protein [Siccirubricoccus phaeus]